LIPITDQIKRNIPSHKAPVVCLKWFPSSLEIEMKKSYSAIIQPLGSEINQFATISTDGQVLLWEKKFLDSQKKPITDVNFILFSILLSIGKQAMVFICLDLKEEELWEVHILPLVKIKKELFSQVRQIKASYLCVIGQQDQQIKLVAKMTLLLLIGINRDVIDL
jgi:hypothetical protein